MSDLNEIGGDFVEVIQAIVKRVMKPGITADTVQLVADKTYKIKLAGITGRATKTAHLKFDAGHPDQYWFMYGSVTCPGSIDEIRKQIDKDNGYEMAILVRRQSINVD